MKKEKEMNKRSNMVPLIIAACAAMVHGISAASSTALKDAKVVSSKPIIETAYEPYEKCSSTFQKKNPYARRNDNVNQVVGGLVGGGLGALAGKGSGKDAAAALGAVVGSEVLNPDNDGLTEGEIIGAIAGGVIGNQVGKGSGKTAATASGALIGKIVADNLESEPASSPSSGHAGQAAPAGYERVRSCRTLEREKKVITGYEVQYLYDGEVFTGVLPYDPGDTVKIAVDVEIVEEVNR